MRVGVLGKHALTSPGAHGLRLGGIVEQLPVGGERLARVSTTTISEPGSNQCSIPACGLETIAAPAAASSKGRHVEDPAPSHASAASRSG